MQSRQVILQTSLVLWFAFDFILLLVSKYEFQILLLAGPPQFAFKENHSFVRLLIPF